MRPSRTLPRSRVTVGQAGAPSVEDIEKLEAIRDVMEYAARVTVQTALAKEMKSFRARPILLGILATLSLALAAFTFTAEPDWVFGPSTASASPALRDAHLRYAMFLAVQRLESSRDSVTREPPATLAEVGEDWSGFEYRVLGLGVFELRARGASGDEIVFKSGEDLKALLGDGRRRLREARP